MDFEWTNKDRNVISMDSPFNAPAKREAILPPSSLN